MGIVARLLALSVVLGAGVARGDGGLSTSVMRPTLVPPNGVVSGALTTEPTRYYLTVDVQPGDLLTQIGARGTAGQHKEVQLEVLDAEAKARGTYWAQGTDPKVEETESFPIDSSGKQVLRLTVRGPGTGRFCLQLGGTSFHGSGEAVCPEDAAPGGPGAAAPAARAAPPPARLEVIEGKCEQRLRMGADVLFAFDSARLSSDAAPTIGELQKRLASSSHPARIEGHTDAKGSDAYNDRLSLERAQAVRDQLLRGGVVDGRLQVQAFGKKSPVAPNTRPDGSDDPAGRRRNRRVEVVVDTCA